MENNVLLDYVVATLLIIIPCWKIFRRVGLSPAFSLFALIPVLGWLIAAAILAFLRWPAFEEGRSGGMTHV